MHTGSMDEETRAGASCQCAHARAKRDSELESDTSEGPDVAANSMQGGKGTLCSTFLKAVFLAAGFLAAFFTVGFFALGLGAFFAAGVFFALGAAAFLGAADFLVAVFFAAG